MTNNGRPPARSATDSTGIKPEVYRELVEALNRDDSRLGQVYRLLNEGCTPAEVASRLAIPTSGFVSNNRHMADVLLGEATPTSVTLASEIYSRVGVWLRAGHWSQPTRLYLGQLRDGLGTLVEELGSVGSGTKRAARGTKPRPVHTDGGVFVYSFPHYLRFPYEPSSGRTLLRVGQGSVSALMAPGSATRDTFVPEDPWVLRVYTHPDPAELLANLRAVIARAGHGAAPGQRSGDEWFVTSLPLLDRLALANGAEVGLANDFKGAVQ